MVFGWILSAKYFRDITQKPILPIIQTEDKPNKINQVEFEKQLIESLKNPAEGTIIFFLEDLLKDPDKIAVVRSFFK